MPEVIQLKHKYVNSFIIREKRPVLVDAETPGSESSILDKIKTLGYNPEEVSLIVITHGHYDHF